MPAAELTTLNVIALAAGSSVLAAFVTQGLTEVRERWNARREAAFSALYLALALESYASECSTALSESENYQHSGGHAGSAQGNIPVLPDYPSTMEWKAFGIGSTTQAMSFRVEVETTMAMISGHWEFGDEDDVVPLVREEAARLGLKALASASEFRKAWGIAPVDYSSEWNVKTYLTERCQALAAAKKDREERNRKFNEELFGKAAEPPSGEETA